MEIDGLGMLRGVLEANWVVVGVDVSVSEGESKWERDRFFPPHKPLRPFRNPLGLACLWLSADPIRVESRIP